MLNYDRKFTRQFLYCSKDSSKSGNLSLLTSTTGWIVYLRLDILSDKRDIFLSYLLSESIYNFPEKEVTYFFYM